MKVECTGCEKIVNESKAIMQHELFTPNYFCAKSCMDKYYKKSVAAGRYAIYVVIGGIVAFIGLFILFLAMAG